MHSQAGAWEREWDLCLETDLGHFALGFNFNLEEIRLVKVEHAGNDVAGEHLDLVVELEYRIVITLAHGADAVFRVGEFPLELEEVGVGLEVGVVFDHDIEVAESLAQLAFGLGLVAHTLCVLREVTGLGDVFEGIALVGHVALGGFDEVGDEVVAALEDYIDLGPGFFNAIAQAHEAVIRPHDPQADDDGDSEND